ncbi:MAG: hypothetical protein LBR16_07760 [Treponema sp.]|jgi:hypothetical protein|nr:hypothetical protein [Treponema sp.]
MQITKPSYERKGYGWIRGIAAAILFFLAPTLAFPQGLPLPSGFDLSGFGYVFDRADREVTPEKWLAEARSGFAEAAAGWESFILAMYDDPETREAAREALAQTGEAELEKRFTQWLFTRFFNSDVQSYVAGVSQEVRDAGKDLLYQKDEQGNILRDPETGDPLIIRTDEEEAAAGQAAWRERVAAAVYSEAGRYADELSAGIEGLFPELLAYITEENRGRFLEALSGAAAAAIGTLQSELEALASREERIAFSRYADDLYSLRKKSEDETAAAITSRLIESVRASCDEGLSSLQAKIAGLDANADDLSIAGEDWLAQYREQFERGLRAWESAEEQFYVSRFEWEQETGRVFSESEAVWAAAYEQFDAERAAWEAKAQELFASGEEVFRKASEELARAMEDAKAEFEKDASVRLAAVSEAVQAWISMYQTCGSVMTQSNESMSFWMDEYIASFEKYRSFEKSEPIIDTLANVDIVDIINNFVVIGNKKVTSEKIDVKTLLSLLLDKSDLSELEFSSGNTLRLTIIPTLPEEKPIETKDLSEYIDDIIAHADTGLQNRMTLPDFFSDAFDAWLESELAFCAEYGIEKGYNALSEMREWTNLYRAYYARALEVRDAMVSEYYSALGNAPLNSVLSSAASSENFYLDSYQTELLRVQAESRYWDRRLQIAEAVLAYANDLSAGRTTEGESIALLQETKAAYDDAAANYNDVLARLGAAGELTAQLKQELAEGAQKLADMEDEMARLNQEYNDLAALSKTIRVEEAKSELNKTILEMSAAVKALAGEGDTSIYAALLSKLAALGAIEALEERAEQFAFLVQGGEGYASLAELVSAAAEREAEVTALTPPPPGEGEEPQSESAALLEARDALDAARNALAGRIAELEALKVDAAQEKENAITALIGFFNTKGLPSSRSGALLPDSKTIAAYLFNAYPASIQDGLVSFLLELDAIMSALPEYVQTEYDSWKTTLVEYAAVKALLAGKNLTMSSTAVLNQLYLFEITSGGAVADMSDAQYAEYANVMNALIYQYTFAAAWEESEALIQQAELSGYQHWRELIAQSAASSDPEGDAAALKSAASIGGALLADYYNDSARSLARLSEMFDIYFNSADTDAEAALNQSIARYLANPTLAWDDSVLPRNDTTALEDEIAAEQGKILAQRNIETSLAGTISNLDYIISLFASDDGTTESALAEKEAELREMNAAFEQLGAEQAALREAFSAAALAYDALYKESKDAYDAMQSADFEYQKQDAIRRWAATAYLDAGTVDAADLNPDRSPAEEAAYAKANKEKALQALDALKALYAAGETTRPFAEASYQSLYAAYGADYADLLFVIDAAETLSSSAAKQLAEAQRQYENYLEQLAAFGVSFNLDPSKLGSTEKSAWTILDMIRVNDGLLEFARTTGTASGSYFTQRDAAYMIAWLQNSGSNGEHTTDFILAENTDDSISALVEYFNALNDVSREPEAASAMELAIRQLAVFLDQMALNQEMYLQWGLARDYLVWSLANENKEVTWLQEQVHHAEELQNGSLGNMETEGVFDYMDNLIISKEFTKLKEVNQSYQGLLYFTQKEAYESLTDEEKRYLEFYTILTLLGGGGEGAENFARVSEYYEYKYAYDIAYKSYRKRRDAFMWWLRKALTEKLDYTKNKAKVPYDALAAKMQQGTDSLNNDVDSFVNALSAYEAAAEEYAIRSGEAPEGETLTWDVIANALSLTGKYNTADLNHLETLWLAMQSESDTSYTNAIEGLNGLAAWALQKRNGTLTALNDTFSTQEARRQIAEAAYQSVYEAYLAGTVDAETLALALANAYGRESASAKTHLQNMGNVIIANLQQVMTNSQFSNQQFSITAQDYLTLMQSLYADRYSEELSARMDEWSIQIHELGQKYESWQNASALILERGRQDWKESLEQMNASYANWKRNFQQGYNNAIASWNDACLEGLLRKEEWIAQAEEAVMSGSDEAMLNLLGASAEASARYLDTRQPISTVTAFTPEDAEAMLSGFLSKAGIANMSGAMETLIGLGAGVSTQVRRGLASGGAWEKSAVTAQAQTLARESAQAISVREAKKVAVYARQIVEDALEQLKANVKFANEGFGENMDDLFVFAGQFVKQGRNYVKDVIVHSTLIDNVITERAKVEVYNEYVMPEITDQPDLSDAALNGLGSIAIDRLLQAALEGVQKMTEQIFGNTEEHIDGEFTGHIGEAPDFEAETDGTGECGRLVSEYYKWAQKEAEGLAKMNVPGYSKPMWDDRDSWMKAPSIRSIVDIGVSIAVSALGLLSAAFTGPLGVISAIATVAALNTADDLVFNALDVEYKQKTWDEFGVETGKTLLTNVVSASAGVLGSALTGGLSTLAGNITKAAGWTSSFAQNISTVAVKTTVAGVQTAFTTAANATIQSVQYSHEGGFSWNGDTFLAGLDSTWKGSLTSMTSALVGTSLNTGLTGFHSDYHFNGAKLNSLISGAAAQGVNLALGGDFTLNVLNTDLFSNNEEWASGLFELHFGKDGFSANIGTGGLDTSIGSLVRAAAGAETWKVNLDLLASKQEESKLYASQLRTLYSGDAKNRAEYDNILAGRTNVEMRDVAETQSIRDKKTGIKTIYLGNDARNSSGDFDLNVWFAHESYRNGEDDGEAGQIQERDAAVTGHINTALELMGTYGKDSISNSLSKEALLYKIAEKVGSTQTMNNILNSYDTEEDFWKTKLYANGNNEVVPDGKKEMTLEYLDKKGNAVSSYTPEGQQVSLYDMAGALVYGITIDQALTLLADHPDFYAVYQEILYDSDDLTEAQWYNKIGALLLEASGRDPKTGKSVTTDSATTPITIAHPAILQDLGSLYANVDSDGYLTYSTIKAYVHRYQASYESWSDYEKDENKENQAKDEVIYVQQTLSGQIISEYYIEGVQTVDNMRKKSPEDDKNLYDQKSATKGYENYQGGTVAPGDFYLGYYAQSQNKQFQGIVDDVNNAVLIINDATTLAGETIGKNGTTATNKEPWEMHSNYNAKYKKDYNSYYSDGCFIMSTEKMNAMLAYLSSIGLKKGVQIKTTLSDFSDYD